MREFDTRRKSECLANRYRLRKVIVRQESKITVDVIARKPPTAAIQFTIPPPTRITIEDADDLACTESETSGITLVRNIVVHSKDIFWLGPFGRGPRAQVYMCVMCVDSGC